MDISSSLTRTRAINRRTTPPQPERNSDINMDSISDTVLVGGAGAVPGFGVVSNLTIGYLVRENDTAQRLAIAGAGSNLIGTLSLGAYALTGSDTALTLALSGLAGSSALGAIASNLG